MRLARCAWALSPTTRFVALSYTAPSHEVRFSASFSGLRSGRSGCRSPLRQIHEQSASRPKRPSPYRLLQPHTFLAAFAPLHVAGWRLESLAETLAPSTSSSEGLRLEDGMDDLQGRRLVRVYRFSEGREGWRDLMGMIQDIGRVVEDEDHHPKITIAPALDHISDPAATDRSGYVIEISTYTHTPMPPLRSVVPMSGSDPSPPRKVQPGVTGKDTNLATKIEEAYKSRTSDVPV